MSSSRRSRTEVSPQLSCKSSAFGPFANCFVDVALDARDTCSALDRPQTAFKPQGDCMCTSIRGSGWLVSVASILILSAAHAQERNAYFGQTHQHTSWSLDAYILGNTVTGPEEAYQYSMGQTIKHPAGYDVKDQDTSRLSRGHGPFGICGSYKTCK